MGLTITVIGGGVGGCATALELANAGYNVILIESKEFLLSGSSDVTPCRLGLGFHYIDKETAIKYLIATINFVKKYPGFKITDKSEFRSEIYLERGRYFITKDTLFDAKKVLILYKRLQQKYHDLCKQDPSNQVFGSPEKFFRILSQAEFSNDVDISKVSFGIETAETSFNWPDFKKHFSQLIVTHPNITVKISSEVVDVKRNYYPQGFLLTIKNLKEDSITTLTSELVVNASWYNIEAINHKVGLLMPAGSRTNRLKVMIEIGIPEKLKNKNSMFFCFGPHCSFTNVGSGKGFITYEPVTNIKSSIGLHISPLAKRFISGHATNEEKKELAKKIIAGVSQYIPEISQARFVDAHFGVVKTNGRADIYAAQSELHRRRESGVQEREIGWIENACMKLLYFHDNAISVTHLVKKHHKIMLSKALVNEQLRQIDYSHIAID